MSLRVDIISDVVCPWCYIGYRNLEKALEIAGIEADIHWQPFELNQQIPPEGKDVAQHLLAKGLGPDQLAANRHHLDQLGAGLGIKFHRGEGNRIFSSHAAHQLLHWARDSGKQTALKLALFDAYFARNDNISEREILLAAVDKAGLDRAEAAAVLEDGRFAETVRTEQLRWREMGINSVPAMVFDEKALVVGSQEPERLAIAIQRFVAKLEA